MQTTLLGLAIAIILALVAALVGPLLVDWSSHRTLFEAEASRLIGVNVRVTGGIDARLLPSPRLTLHEIQIGDGSETVRARSLGVEFALGSLMRGEWRAAELHLVGPQVRLGLDSSGRLQAPNLAMTFKPDELSIDRLSIEDGTVVLTDAASGTSLTLGRAWFNGEARSLVGPVKGEGAVTVAGALYPYRLALGRVSEGGTLKLHLNVDPTDYSLNFEADGTLAFAGNMPGFDGTLGLARPVGIGLRRPGPAAGDVTQPWRVGGKIKATAQSALIQDVEFQYGSEEQGFRLTGVADFKFGAKPRFNGVLSGRQIDADRAVSGGGGGKQAPAAVIRQLLALGTSAFRTSLPVQLGIGIDQVTLGGNSLQNLRGDITSNASGWSLDRLEFRAPGLTQVRLSGRLAVGNDGVAFSGPAQIDSSDPRALALWLEGRGDTTQGDIRPLSLHGDVTLASDRIAVEQLKAEFDRRPVTGRLGYTLASAERPAKLDAELKAPQLDIDAALGFGRALLAGSMLERPREMTLVIEIGRALFSGIDAGNARVHMHVDPDGLQVDRLTIGDIGGGSFSAAGRIETKGNVPRGSFAVDLETTKAAAIATIVEKVVPEGIASAVRILDRVGRAKLHGTLDVAGDDKTSATTARVAVTGTLDELRLDARARVSGDWQSRSVSLVEMNATVDATVGSLVKFAKLDEVVASGNGPAQLKASLKGPVGGDLTFDVQVAGEGLAARLTGKGKAPATGRIQGDALVEVREARLKPLRPGPVAANAGQLPFRLSSRVALAAGALTFDDIDAKLGASTIHGRFRIDDASPRRVEGALDANVADSGSLLAIAIGLPRAVKDGPGWSWSSEPFSPGLFGRFAGEIAFRFGRVELLPNVNGRDLRGTVRFGGDNIALDGAGEMAGGKLAGIITFRNVQDGLDAHVKMSLAGADAAALFSGVVRPPVAGLLNLNLEGEATGLSAVALVGSAKGSGKIELTDAQLAGLDPRTFDAVTRAVDQGLAIEQGRIADVVRKSIGSGRLSVRRAESALTVSAGQIRLSKPIIDSKDAALSVAGAFDLTDGLIDARLVLSGQSEAAGARPDIFIALKGPMPDVSYNIDVSALTGWLTLRAVENQTKRLRAIEPAPPHPAARPAPKINSAPPLPAPTDIKPAPKPRNVGRPAASVGTQN
ncbi:MAG TPA: AsmA family protein [Pseudolabrys sp.]|nr:AsmA family protein [Pseudolabrys sp.]